MAIRVPGIIVRIVNDTGIIAPPLYQRYPVIIGEGDPYKLVENVAIVRSTGVVDSIPTTTTVNSIINVGDLPGIAKYVSGADYHLVGNVISWQFAGDQPTLGDTYYMTFTETRPASAYVPTLYLDGNLIYLDHGYRSRTNGDINDVSVGGDLVLQQGGNGVIIAQLDLSAAADPDAPTPAELETAFTTMRDALEKITGYKLFLVPMSSGTLNTTTAANIFFNHAVLMSQPEQKRERTVLAALAMGTTYQNAATFAQTYVHERMVVPFVPAGTVNVTGFTSDYDMRYYNAGLAGKLCSVGIGRTISDEIIFGLTFDDNFTLNEANYLVQRGVSPAKIDGEVVRNIMAITTDTTNALTEDLGVQDVKDYVRKYWREGLWTAYKNAPITDDLIGRITVSSEGIMGYLIDQTIISDYRNVTVSQDSVEPRKINVTGSIKPAYGLQWMDITFTFVLSF